MVRWNKQKRKEQSERVRQVKPWLNAHGAVTPEGKARSKMNALKEPSDRKTLMIKRLKKLDRHSKITLNVQERLKQGKPISDVFWFEFIKLMNELEDEFKDD